MVACFALRGTTELFGDGQDYIIQSQSLAIDKQISIDCSKRMTYWNETNPFGVRSSSACLPSNSSIPQVQGSAGGLFQDLNGNYRYFHFFIYPLLVAPVLFILHAYSKSALVEYSAFHLINVALISIPLLLTALFQRRSSEVFILTCCIIFSPLIAYTSWASPEVMTWSLVCSAFILADKFCLLSAALVGVAAMQNPPVAAFLVPLILVSKQKVFTGLIGFGLAITPALYFKKYFGVWNLISATGGASFSCMSGGRLLDIFIHPIEGCFWYYSLLLSLSLVLIFSAPTTFRLTLVAATFAAACLSTSTTNFHSVQLGAIRYGTWILAPWFAEVALNCNSRKWLTGCGAACGIFVAAWTNTVSLPLKRVGESIGLPEFSKSLMETTGYVGDVEALVELVDQRELIAPWNFSKPLHITFSNHSLWIIPLRGIRSGQETQILPSAANEKIPNASLRINPIFGKYYLVWI